MKKRLILLIILLVVLASAFLYVQMYYNGDKTRRVAYKRAEKIALNKADIEKIHEIYLYYEDEQWTVITGENKQGVNIGVWIPEKSDNVIIHRLSRCLSKSEAVKTVKKNKDVKKILHAKLGMKNKQPIWEITYLDKKDALKYYILDF